MPISGSCERASPNSGFGSTTSPPVIAVLADTGSVLELRAGFGRGMVTALVRIEGRPVGVVANDPGHLGGAIDRDGADKAARFLQLCDAHDLPVLFLCDTPGFMVGPEAERTAQVRHFSRLFVIGASLTVPFFTIVVRKGYGLGAQAMAGGSFRSPLFVVAWPSGELGGMGLEGAVRLGFRRELDAVEDPVEREALFRVDGRRRLRAREGLNVATAFEIDDVIDPAESRARIVEALRSAPPPPARTGRSAAASTPGDGGRPTGPWRPPRATAGHPSGQLDCRRGRSEMACRWSIPGPPDVAGSRWRPAIRPAAPSVADTDERRHGELVSPLEEEDRTARTGAYPATTAASVGEVAGGEGQVGERIGPVGVEAGRDQHPGRVRTRPRPGPTSRSKARRTTSPVAPGGRGTLSVVPRARGSAHLGRPVRSPGSRATGGWTRRGRRVRPRRWPGCRCRGARPSRRSGPAHPRRPATGPPRPRC